MSRTIFALGEYLGVRDEVRGSIFALGGLVGRVGFEGHEAYRDVGVLMEGGRWVLLLLPRETWKTTVVGLGVAVLILRDPDERILMCHATAEKSQENMLAVRKLFETREVWWAFPDVVPSKDERERKGTWNTSGFLVKRRDPLPVELTVQHGSIEKELTGGHYTGIVVDDAVGKTTATNPQQMEKVKGFFRTLTPLLQHSWKGAAVRPLGAPPAGCRVWVPGTHWALRGVSDAYQDMKDGSLRGPDGEPYVYYCRKPIEVDGEGRAFTPFPNIHSVEGWEKKRAGMAAEDWAAWYENDPKNAMNTMFTREDAIRYFTEAPHGCVRYVLVDPAISTNTKADPTAIVVVDVSQRNAIYVQHVVKRRMGDEEGVATINGLAAAWKPRSVVIEAVGFQRCLATMMRMTMGPARQWFNIRQVKAQKTAKVQRIKWLAPLFTQGYVFIKQGMAEVEADILSYWPGCTDDHVLDALALLQEVFVPKVEEAEDEEWASPIPLKFEQYQAAFA